LVDWLGTNVKEVHRKSSRSGGIKVPKGRDAYCPDAGLKRREHVTSARPAVSL
jgi:hypothetical protein